MALIRTAPRESTGHKAISRTSPTATSTGHIRGEARTSQSCSNCVRHCPPSLEGHAANQTPEGLNFLFFKSLAYQL